MLESYDSTNVLRSDGNQALESRDHYGSWDHIGRRSVWISGIKDLWESNIESKIWEYSVIEAVQIT